LAAGDGVAIDGIGVHPYGVAPDDSFCQTDGINCAWGRLAASLSRAQAAWRMPVWVTEFGLDSSDTAAEADYVEVGYRELAAAGVPHAFYFCYSDAMVAPFGLTDGDWAPKPDAFARYQQISGAPAPTPPAPPPPAA